MNYITFEDLLNTLDEIADRMADIHDEDPSDTTGIEDPEPEVTSESEGLTEEEYIQNLITDLLIYHLRLAVRSKQPLTLEQVQSIAILDQLRN